MTAAISSQPLRRSRLASAPTATSRLRVANDTEMNAPIAMMNTMTPIWPNIRPTVSVSTNLGLGVQQAVDAVDRRQHELLDRLAEAQRRRHLLERARDR